jgi:hypothetical protein
MKPEDLKKAPKLFAENIKIAHTSEYFVVGISSGSQAQIFSLTPGHTKRLAQYLEHEIKNFEEKNGVIDSKWNPNIVSPVQPRKPPTEGS